MSLLFDLVRAEGTVRDEITAAQRVGIVGGTVPQNAPQTTAEDLPRIIIKPHEGIDELIREAKQEQSAKTIIGARVKSYLIKS